MDFHESNLDVLLVNCFSRRDGFEEEEGKHSKHCNTSAKKIGTFMFLFFIWFWFMKSEVSYHLEVRLEKSITMQKLEFSLFGLGISMGACLFCLCPLK